LIFEADDELNSDSAASLIEGVQQQITRGLRKVVVDCSKVGYLHTPGIANLVSLHVRLRKSKGHLAVCSVSERILGLFHVVRLDQLLDIQPNVESACAAVRGEGEMPAEQ
jgi:anti-anti-sigma factor